MFYTFEGKTYLIDYVGDETELVLTGSYQGIDYEIASYAFSYCSQLRRVVISKGIKSVAYGMFYGCDNLTEVVLSDGVTSISGEAFSSCLKLAKITISDSVRSIGADAFLYCYRLVCIDFQGEERQWWAIDKGKDWRTEYPLSCIIKCKDVEIDINA